ncbi:unnamed protein product [Pleuronectes platessa]|uniref:Uncharacterized protein n=1 Tax=Pleuronectes platessa TaxID=8262 RepID=A0A9N7YEH0_PLEPL|nr:unnamed protein product [Pleuronectes platessa]
MLSSVSHTEAAGPRMLKGREDATTVRMLRRAQHLREVPNLPTSRMTNTDQPQQQPPLLAVRGGQRTRETGAVSDAAIAATGYVLSPAPPIWTDSPAAPRTARAPVRVLIKQGQDSLDAFVAAVAAAAAAAAVGLSEKMRLSSP